LIYWKNFARDCKSNEFARTEPLADWRTNSQRLHAQLKQGDRFWFIAAGESCDAALPLGGYLVNAFSVRSVTDNAGDDPEYSPEDFRFTVLAEPDKCVWFSPPLLADQIVRPAGHAADVHIGSLLQGPRKLTDAAVISLVALISDSDASRLGA